MQKETLDCLIEEADAGEPKMMTVVLHPHICGRPNRAIHLKKYAVDSCERKIALTIPSFIEYAQSKGAWFARRSDIAEHWRSKFPYDASKAFGQTPVPACGQISSSPQPKDVN